MKKVLLAALLVLPIFSMAQTTEPDPLSPSLSEEQQQIYDELLDIINQSGDSVNPNTGLPQGFEESLDVIVTPEIPLPGQLATITLESYSINLDASSFTWTQDGRVFARGRGIRTINLRAPESGKSITVVVTIVKNTGGTIQRTITIAPSTVNLLYEADTFTPPFYKGGSLFTIESPLVFVAMPEFLTANGARISAESLIYTWKIDDSVIRDVSGAGRYVFRYNGSVIQRPMLVSVEVTSADQSLQGTDSVYIQPVDPYVVLYEKNPLLGPVFEQAVAGNFVMNRDEITVLAAPYFFNAQTFDDARLSYNWSTNSGAIPEIISHEITLRNELKTKGTENLSVSVEHSNNILQSARTHLQLLIDEIATDFSF